MRCVALLLIVPATAWGSDLALDGSDFPWGVLATEGQPCEPIPIPEGTPEVPESTAACTVQPDIPTEIGPLTCELLSYTWVDSALLSVGCHTRQATVDVRELLRDALGRGKTRWRLDEGREVRLMYGGDYTVVLWWKPPPAPPEEMTINPGFP